MCKLISFVVVYYVCIILLAVQNGEAAHTPPFSHRETSLHERLMSHHKVAAWLDTSDAKPFSRVRPEYRQMKTLAANEWQGLRIHTNFDRLAEAKYTCHAATPKSKLEQLTEKAATAGASTTVAVNDPAVYHASQDPQVIEVTNRDVAGTVKNVTCKKEYEIDAPRDAFVRQLMRDVTSKLSSLLSPVVLAAGGTSIAGNKYDGTKLQCFSNPHYSWSLSSDLVFQDVDLVFMVTAEPDWANSFALPCQTAADGRPSIVVLNIAPNWLVLRNKPGGVRALRNRVLQSIFKALGLSVDMFSKWKQAEVYKAVQIRGHQTYMIVTPNVKSWVEKEQFRCTGNPRGGSGFLGGAELEDGLDDTKPKFYWEKRIFAGEIMTMVDFVKESPANIDPSKESLVVSGLTLAALADTGFFNVNMDLAERLTWGYDQPCEWAQQKCDLWTSRYSCLDSTTENIPQCTADYTSTATCNGITFGSAVPAHFRYRANTNPNYGGRDKLRDFCPVLEPKTSCLIYETDMTKPDCSIEACPEFHVKGPGSRCFPSSLRYKKFDPSSTPKTTTGATSSPSAATRVGTCIHHECKLGGANNNQQTVVLHVADQFYTCYNKGDVVGPSVANSIGVKTANGDTLLGEIVCPDPVELCAQAGPSVFEAACSPLDDCSGHGTCNTDGTCKCFSECGPDAANCAAGSKGFFAGEKCDRCQEGYLPPECVKPACPRDPSSGQSCFGHGTCNPTDGSCKCFFNATHGYWDTLTNCQSCNAGYTGGGCRVAACVAQGCGRGTCNTATKRCVCDASENAGYWTGLRCDRCQDGYELDTGCRKRFTNQCGTCTSVSSSATISTPDEVPSRIAPTDSCGCPIDSAWPTLSTHMKTLQTCTCIEYEELQIDCKGYPMLFDTCFVKDSCGCSPRPRPTCKPGTDRVASSDAYPLGVVGKNLMMTPSGATDTRAAPVATVTDKQCKCPTVQPTLFDCVGGNTDLANPTNPALIVWFEPKQRYFEDFCHCVSPRIPSCTAITQPQKRPQLAKGTQFNCNDVVCPDWSRILNVDQKVSNTKADLSVIDCDGFPAPQLESPVDECGCPFPVFKCRSGSEGICLADSCPKWDKIEVNCQGKAPPTLNWHGPHPCGCEPPPPIVCMESTVPKCDCRVPERVIEQVDCKGMPLHQPMWSPYIVYTSGDPFIQLCDPCPQCAQPAPILQCIAGSDKPIPKSDNPVSSCPNGAVAPYPKCPNYPVPCPVDCRGKPPPQPKSYDPNCECPPMPQPPCIDGTDGTTSDVTLRAGTCASTPSMCHPYVCGDASSSTVLEKMGVLSQCNDRQKRALEMLPSSAPALCVQEGSCQSDNDCACGFKCGPCGICIDATKPVMGCLKDPSVCGSYACKPSCDQDGIERIKNGELVGECVAEGQCASHEDCARGSMCSIATYTPRADAGKAAEGLVQVVGDAPESTTQQTSTSGVPGINPNAATPSSDPLDPRTEFTPKRHTGFCFQPREPNFRAVQYCTAHDQCNGYACGKDNSQVFFANSRCRATCAVNEHCQYGWRCMKGACVSTQSTGTGESGMPASERPSVGCEVRAADHCFPYVCGFHRGAAPGPEAACRTSCTEDNHCHVGYVCAIPTEKEVKEKFSGSGTAAPTSSAASHHERVLHAHRRRRFGTLASSASSTTQTSSKDAAATTAGLSSQKAAEMDPAATTALTGKCVPSQAMLRGAQTESELQAELANNPFVKNKNSFSLPPGTKAPMLTVPIGHIDINVSPDMVKPGKPPLTETDPNSIIMMFAPYAPPPTTKPPPTGTAVGTSTASCRPYKGAMRGATQAQLSNLNSAAKMANAAGHQAALPECKTSCQTDDDCVGGFYCTRPAPTRTATTEGGQVISTDPNCNSQDGNGCRGNVASGELKAIPKSMDSTPEVGDAPQPGTCQRKRSLGTACSVDNECGSGFCVRGVCCNTACNSPCMTCANQGVCNYVFPQTDPERTCGKCSWCDYSPSVDGKKQVIKPSSPLVCVPVPFGRDPGRHCGDHGVCNGEGGCMAQDGWGGANADSCAAGKTGPNCDEDLTNYRTVEVQEKYHVCTAEQVAAESGAPSTDPTTAKTTGSAFRSRHHTLGRTTKYRVRTAHGLAETSLPTTYPLRTVVADRRPRQYASTVLGLSGHGPTSCKSILREPMKASKRIHAESAEAWSPMQYYKKESGEAINANMRYFPWVNCRQHQTETPCTNEKGCVWKFGSDSGGFCTGDGTVVTEADAKRVLGITTKQQTVSGTYTYNTGALAPMPLEWIELEFPEAVFIEAVQIFESFNPGSVIKIESQPVEVGSQALAAQGGGAPQTTSSGADVESRRQHVPEQRGSPAGERRCTVLTPLGKTGCYKDTTCAWDGVRCHFAQAETLKSCPVVSAACATTPGCVWNAAGGYCYRESTATPGATATPSSTPTGNVTARRMTAQSAASNNGARYRYSRPQARHATQREYIETRTGDHPYSTFRLRAKTSGDRKVTTLSETDHPHHLMRILDASIDASTNGKQPTSLVRAFCEVDFDWIPPASESQRTPSECANLIDEFNCNSFGGCKWNTGTSIGPNTPLPPASQSSAETGSYGGMESPRPFTLQDAGPEYPADAEPPHRFDMPPSSGNVACDTIPAGESLNRNTNAFHVIWERDTPNFVTTNKYRDEIIDVGRAKYRSKVIRLTLAPVSSGLSQIDAVAIIGAQRDRNEDGEPLCGGEVWASSVPEGTPTTARVTQNKVQPVPCSGNGKCGPKGCECFGNFFGKYCEACKLGFSGPACDKPVEFGCKRAFYEDLGQLGDEVLARWKFTNLKNFSSSATPMKYFGSSMYSPVYDIGGDSTHIQITANVLVVDVPAGDDVGIYLSVARDHGGRDLRIVKVEKPQFFSGLNLIGTENGDYQGDIKAKVKWPHPSASVNVTLWWGSGSTGDFTLTLNSLEIEACRFPDLGEN
eukprot:PhM_4_TR2122/c0_g1_i1/m.19281